MPDLSFQLEGVEVDAVRRVAAARASGSAPPTPPPTKSIHTVVAARPDHARGRPGGTTRPRKRRGSWTCSAARSAGAGPCGRCSGPTPTSCCRGSQGETVTDLPVPCTLDFNVAATKYFYGLTEGEVPLDFLFSGSVFYEDADGRAAGGADLLEPGGALPPPGGDLAAAHGRLLPEPGLALQLRRDVFDRLYHYKMEHGIPTWEQALEGAPAAGGRGGAGMSGGLGRAGRERAAVRGVPALSLPRRRR